MVYGRVTTPVVNIERSASRATAGGPAVDTRTPRMLAALLSVALVTTVATVAVALPADAATHVKNPNFAKSTAGWSASMYATKSRVRDTISGKKSYAGQVKRRAKKARSIRLTSSVTARRVSDVGSVIRTTARVKASKAGRTITYRVYEVSGSKVIGVTHKKFKARKSWFTVSVKHRTVRPRTHFKVAVQMDGATKGQSLRITNVRTSVTPPTKQAPVTPGTPNPTTGQTPTPAAAGPCEDVDYKDPAQGRLSYAEEFNGTSLDPKKWRIRDNTFLNQDAAYIDKKNVSVHDGYLDIVGKREPEANWRTNYNALYGAENRIRKYSTGYVDTIKSAGDGADNRASAERFSQKYGYYEARMWVPSTDKMSQGIWPAFWLRGDRVNGEIDVMESYGSPTIRNNYDPSPSYEWNSWEDTSQVSTRNHFQGRPAVTEPIHRNWHVYGVNWSPSCLRYTLDGKTVGTARPVAGEVPYINGPTFDSPFHLRLNMQIGSKYWGWPDSNVTRDEFHFKTDYVRVYQGFSPARAVTAAGAGYSAGSTAQ
jgi:beta-glucanase (GH16 family)